MIKKEFIRLKVADLIPYENNPRVIPPEAIEAVVQSDRQCGNGQPLDPIEVDEDNVILSGHTRRLAFLQEGIEEADVIRYTGMTKKQKKKYRLLANKTGEFTAFDYNLLPEELDGLDFEGFDFGFEEDAPEEYVEDFFDRGVEAKDKPVVYGVKVICGTQEQVDEVIQMLSEAGYSPEQL